jgi:VIT1/CCC1 family predicted Fe2+/Mn2+ transporter
MEPASARRRLVEFLDPTERFGEILFGLIMVLTFTLGAGLTVSEGPGVARELLIAAIGCNVAWGLIDGVMVAMNRLAERGRLQRVAREVRAAATPAAALGVVRRELEPTLGPLVGSEERERLYAEVRQRAAALPAERVRLERDDVLAALASFWLVFLSTIPAVLPFLVLSPARLALRVSNALLLLLLFAVGWRWAGYTGGSPLGTGLALLAIGTTLVVVAIALGG